MIRIEDNCVCCDLPCINCGRRHEKVLYCDRCSDSFERCYNYNGEDLCKDCFFETIFTESTIEELVDLVNYIFQSNIYKIEDNKFYIDDAENGNFGEFSEEEFSSFLKNDLDNFSIGSVIDYFGNVDIITLD